MNVRNIFFSIALLVGAISVGGLYAAAAAPAASNPMGDKPMGDSYWEPMGTAVGPMGAAAAAGPGVVPGAPFVRRMHGHGGRGRGGPGGHRRYWGWRHGGPGMRGPGMPGVVPPGVPGARVKFEWTPARKYFHLINAINLFGNDSVAVQKALGLYNNMPAPDKLAFDNAIKGALGGDKAALIEAMKTLRDKILRPVFDELNM
ncbi:TPA: hypothetical protein DDZ86_03380 [Candidatus Dependentiae bacterium]|nr:MAG: hypothetical protein UW09_C0003G0027 [candidate division TM6 bacterium GW2011_GWF2_43_87]HBL98657.1 hypothetical protein [Candidatus Dependentiae bacterium]